MISAATDAVSELEKAERELEELSGRIVQLRKAVGAQTIEDYTLSSGDGEPVLLSSLFNNRDDLIVIHNMGKGCRYCTLWADGFAGIHQHLEDRAGFVLVSPDEPSVMKEFAANRGWTFRVLSSYGSPFGKDLGFERDSKPWPGMSTFHREKDGVIRRVASTTFGPGDLYCSIWHMFDLLEKGADGWEPQYSYASSQK